jgi:O-antigen/teichoic acid export membrane protein
MIANFAGSGWTALMSLVFVPLYIRLMGIEAYGLVGFLSTLQAVFGLLDMGLGVTLSRELSRLSVLPDGAGRMRDLVRTLETVYWSIAVLIGAVVVLAAGVIARHWLNVDQMPLTAVRSAVMIMGLAMALQWPTKLYQGGIVGLQKQVSLNVLLVVMSTFRAVGAVVVLLLLAPTVHLFFMWHLATFAMQTLLMAAMLYSSLPRPAERGRFRRKVLREVWRFAAGMTGISVTAVILIQLDKIILSKMLSLEMFGYYAFAATVAMSLCRLTGPIFTALYPRFTQAVTRMDSRQLQSLYHTGCQLMSAVIWPVAIVAAFFSKEILLIWTRDAVATANTSSIVSLLMIGTALHAMMTLPYGMQLAHGWTRLAVAANTAAVILAVPLLIVMTRFYGVKGAALEWVAVNGFQVVVTVQLMHRRILPGRQWFWYLRDTGAPLAAVLAVVGAARLLIHPGLPGRLMFTCLGVTWAAALAAAVFAAGHMRLRVLRLIRAVVKTPGVSCRI